MSFNLLWRNALDIINACELWVSEWEMQTAYFNWRIIDYWIYRTQLFYELGGTEQ